MERNAMGWYLVNMAVWDWYTFSPCSKKCKRNATWGGGKLLAEMMIALILTGKICMPRARET